MRQNLFTSCLLAAASLLLAGRIAWAGPLYDRGLGAYDRVEYAEASSLIARALAEEPFDEPGLVHAYLLYGSALIGMGNEAGAQAAFATLFALEPHYQPGADVSPRVRHALESAAAGAPAHPPRIVHHPPLAPRPTGPVVIEAQVEASPLLRPVVEYRAGTAAPTVAAMSCVGELCQARLARSSPGRLTYRLALETPEGAIALPTSTFELGGAVPLIVASGQERRRPLPLYRRWWLWTAVAAGAAVVAGAITAGVLVHQSQTSLGLALQKQCAGSTNQQCLMPLW